MPRIKFDENNNKYVLTYSKYIEDRFNIYVTSSLIEKYGYGTFEETDKVFEIYLCIYNLYLSEFNVRLKNENSFSLYEQLFVLLEDSIYQNDEEEEDIKNNAKIKAEMSNFDFALYQRALMLILENVVTLELVSDKHLKTESFIEEYYVRAEILVFLATTLYNISFDLTQMKQQKIPYELTMDKYNGYKIELKNARFNQELKLINEDMVEQNRHIRKFDNKEHKESFNSVFYDIFSIQPINILEPAALAINESAYDNQISLAVLYYFEEYAKYLHINYEISKMKAEKLLEGLVLTKENKKSTDYVIQHPNINERFLYRPFLEVKLKGDSDKKLLFGFKMIDLAIDMLSINSFTWKVYPVEWKSNQLDKKVDKIDLKRFKNLENRFEKILQQKKIFYLKSVEDLLDENGKKHTLVHKNCGEVDFIFLFSGKLYIADSKCLRVYADPNGYRIIKDKFTTNNKDGYEKKISKKINYLNQNRKLLKQTFQNKHQKNLDDVDFDNIELKGIFLLSYPTLYMYNSRFMMYSLYSFEKFLNGEKPFPELLFYHDQEDSFETHKIGYPFLEPLQAENFIEIDMNLL